MLEMTFAYQMAKVKRMILMPTDFSFKRVKIIHHFSIQSLQHSPGLSCQKWRQYITFTILKDEREVSSSGNSTLKTFHSGNLAS